jgi:hypothetical protein
MTGVGFQQTGWPLAYRGDLGRAAARMGRQRMGMLALVASLAALPGCKADACGTEEVAGTMAQGVVKGQLQNPETTQFIETTVERDSADPCTYVVTGSYSGLNNFGLTITSDFVVVIQKTRGEDKWEAVNLTIY